MTCAGAVGVLHKCGQLPVIARLGLAFGVIAMKDIEESAKLVIDARPQHTATRRIPRKSIT